MQNKRFHCITTVTVILSLMLAPIAEAKRIGGGGSRGMSRSYSGQSYQSAKPSYQRQQPQPQQGNNTGRLIGAGLAGAAIGAVAGHAIANNNNDHTQANNMASAPEGTHQETLKTSPDQPARGGFSWVWIVIIALAAFFLFRRFKNNTQNNKNPLNQFNQAKQTNYTSHNGNNTNIFGQKLQGGSTGQTMSALADGTQPEAFLRFAKQRFNHVQSMNQGANLEEIRRYFTPDMFTDIKNDIATNQDAAEFSDLQTTLLGSTQENGQYIAGVRFSGLVSEELGSQPVPFSEVWHFVKPVGSQSDWLIAGIEQD